MYIYPSIYLHLFIHLPTYVYIHIYRYISIHGHMQLSIQLWAEELRFRFMMIESQSNHATQSLAAATSLRTKRHANGFMVPMPHWDCNRIWYMAPILCIWHLQGLKWPLRRRTEVKVLAATGNCMATIWDLPALKKYAAGWPFFWACVPEPFLSILCV